MAKIKIDRGVEIGGGFNAHKSKYPLFEMEIKDSFQVPLSVRPNVEQAVWTFCKKHPTRKYTIRKLNDQYCRVWRIK